MPPSGCAFTTRMSAASASATASGSSARRTLSSAAIGMPMYLVRMLISRSSSTLAQGCSTYSRSNGASAWMACSASSTFQPPLASTRMRPSGPSASRTARTRATSSREGLVRCRDLHFRRAASGEAGEDGRDAVGIDCGDRRVHGDAVAQDGRRRVASRSRSRRRARRMPRRRRTRRTARTRSSPLAPRAASPRARRCRGTG